MNNILYKHAIINYYLSNISKVLWNLEIHNNISSSVDISQEIVTIAAQMFFYNNLLLMKNDDEIK